MPKIPLIAVVGNPNAGKTCLFNSLTGANQKVGNYPGVTVERISANAKLGDIEVEFLDIPGLYSMHPKSADEEVATAAILGSAEHPKPDLLVCVLNAANLERNLFLYSQLVDAGIPLLVALTMTDLLKPNGDTVDVPRLAQELDAQIVVVIGNQGRGITALREAILENLGSPRVPHVDFGLPPFLEENVTAVKERLARIGMDIPRAELRIGLLEPEPIFRKKLEHVPEVLESFDSARNAIGVQGIAATSVVSNRYDWAAKLTAQVITHVGIPKRTVSEKMDRILTHRIAGLVVFVGVMYLVFQSIYTFASPVMDGVESVFGWLGTAASSRLESIPWLQSLVVDGILGGMSAAIVFLPQILILFVFISILEGSGYLARAAFLMDRLLGWCGLNGRAFIPLLSSFACAIPGIMAARVMPDPKSRLATILVAPLMSCSARLPVYVLLIGAIIEPKFGAAWAGFTLFAMHLLGLVVAIPVVYILNRGVIKSKRIPFLLELPPYQLPRLKDVWIAVVQRGRVFLQTAGTMIFFMSILIWAASYFPRSDEAKARYRLEYFAAPRSGREDAYIREQELRNSYLGQAGRAIEPVFLPAGFDWRITTSILAAFPAREVVVPSMGILFTIGDQEPESGAMRKAIQGAKWPDGKPLLTEWTAVGLMVFFALCAQCMATLATAKRETNSWKWPLFMFGYMTTLAYLAAVGVHQLGRILGY
ncbi:MAG: ferrous iron transport protein B [Fimbriimonadaceae bacterium]